MTSSCELSVRRAKFSLRSFLCDVALPLSNNLDISVIPKAITEVEGNALYTPIKELIYMTRDNKCTFSQSYFDQWVVPKFNKSH